MNKKAVLMASIFMVLVLGFTVNSAQATTQKAMLWGKVTGAETYYGPPRVMPIPPPPLPTAYGAILVYAVDEPDKARVNAFFYMPDTKEWVFVKLVSVESVQIDTDMIRIEGLWDVYVNCELFEDDAEGYFKSNWRSWGVSIGEWIKDWEKSTTVEGIVTWSKCW